MAIGLLELPVELISQVLSHLHPTDIIHFGQSCKTAYKIIQPSDSVLWHTAFLQVFDDPHKAYSLTQPSGLLTQKDGDNQRPDYWHSQVKRRLTALQAVISTTKSVENIDVQPDSIIETLLEIIETANPGSTESDTKSSALENAEDWKSLNLEALAGAHKPWSRLENLIHDSYSSCDDLFWPHREGPLTRSVTQRGKQRLETACRLHVFYGQTARDRSEKRVSCTARAIVYNWNGPCIENEYGPFKKDQAGMVDWRVLEAVATVMQRHFEIGPQGRSAIPQGFEYAVPYRTLADPMQPEDWARVHGPWIGTYSFLDYADLYNFNTNRIDGALMGDISETHGDLMTLDLKIDMSLRDDRRLQTNLPVSDDLPTLYFSGTSRSLDPHNHPRLMIQIVGSASLCASGREVRWRYIIRLVNVRTLDLKHADSLSFRGQEHWQLEGVQPGGIRSGPVYGTWTQRDHEVRSPVGGFVYMPDELCKLQDLVMVH